jgi:hypothetical protein
MNLCWPFGNAVSGSASPPVSNASAVVLYRPVERRRHTRHYPPLDMAVGLGVQCSHR